MASFRCADCSEDSEFVYDPTQHVCPAYGCTDVVSAPANQELPAEFVESASAGSSAPRLLFPTERVK
jgi:hypothetical protein